MSKIFETLFYSGLTKDKFKKVKEYASKQNRMISNGLLLLFSIIFLFVTVIALGAKEETVSYVVYATAAALFFVLWIINITLSRKYLFVADIIAIISIVASLSVGAAVGILQYRERTTMLLPIFIMVALVYSLRIIYIISFITISEVVYIIFALINQSGPLKQSNLISTIVFAVIGILLGIIITIIKYKSYDTAYINKFLSEKDALTSLYNRHSFENDLEEIKTNKTPIIIYSIDVNGLKALNDKRGHKAGDELLQGAAACIGAVFEPYGKVYRIGGDEFVAILPFDSPNSDELIKQLNETTKAFRGIMIDEISLSIGHAKVDRNFEREISRAIDESDKDMYEQKRAYYENILKK